MSSKSTKSKSPIQTRRFVIDCSIVFSWFFVDESNTYADSVAKSLAQRQALVPGIWPLEVANALVVGERRKRSTEAQATKFIAQLALLPIEIDEQTAKQSWSATIALARQYELSAYDASYLELALREGLPLSTLDESLKKACSAAGVAQYQP